jgi:N-acetylglucosaminyldiphosphoundecaprenol N-acetyl-beta-D-mannosaminyltransferase
VTRIDVLGVALDGNRFDQTVDAVVTAARTREPMRVHFVTVHSLVEATSDERLRKILGTAGLACTDGMPLVWLARRRGAHGAERCAGPDTMLKVCDRGRTSGLRHYFLGGGAGTAETLADRLKTLYPGLKVVGASGPPFRPLTPAEDATLVDNINAANPDVLWIGLGSPKQDYWAAEHADRLRAPLILAVGAAFDFNSGRLRRAPRWMQHLGLEWLFRLATEPRRLWRRYLMTNARFLWLVAQEELLRRRSRSPSADEGELR